MKMRNVDFPFRSNRMIWLMHAKYVFSSFGLEFYSFFGSSLKQRAVFKCDFGDTGRNFLCIEIHGHAELWNFSSHVQLGISLVHCAHSWDFKLNKENSISPDNHVLLCLLSKHLKGKLSHTLSYLQVIMRNTDWFIVLFAPNLVIIIIIIIIIIM